MKRIFFSITASLFLISCGTHPVKPPSVPGALLQKAQWETKAVIRDLKANKSHSVDIDILGDYPGKLRMEVSALMGVQMASLALVDEEIRYAIYPKKQFFQGKANEGSFLPLMNVPLHPRNFMSIAYDVPMRGAGWVCTKGTGNLLSECNQAGRGIKVQWSERTPEGQKKVLITGPTFEMRWLFRPPQTEVQFKDETFLLEAPSEFKIIQLK
jgi:hypothetical protein